MSFRLRLHMCGKMEASFVQLQALLNSRMLPLRWPSRETEEMFNSLCAPNQGLSTHLCRGDAVHYTMWFPKAMASKVGAVVRLLL